MTPGQLNANLRRFYVEARSRTGDVYSKSSLLGLRHAIERYLNDPPLNKGLKLSSDARFKTSNEMLNAQLVNLKRLGKENVKHKPAIEQEDLAKLKSSKVMALTNPLSLSLLRNVWFHVVLFFCRRGREGQRNLKKSSFKFEVDATGRKYVTMSHDEASKNHPGGVNDVPSYEKLARMYETDSVNDGYKAMVLYKSKLSECEAFFQYPKRGWSDEDTMWYEARPLGVNKLDNMMKEISEAAALSKPYTNHSVRATAITLWSNEGIPNRHIMAISGHRNEQSLINYNSQPSAAQLRTCSDVLSRNMLSPASQSSVTVNSQVQQNQVESRIFGSLFNNCTINTVNVYLSSESKTTMTEKENASEDVLPF